MLNQFMMYKTLTCSIAVAISLSWMGGKWYLSGKLVKQEIRKSTTPCITAVASPKVKQPGKLDMSCTTPHVLKLALVKPHDTLVNNPIFDQNLPLV